MADLDDFFAKKDRKKSKSVKKFPTNADELGKKMDDSKLKPDVRQKKDRPLQEGEEGGRGGEEEEWKEYEEPVKDYSGLKIHVLQGGNGASMESGRDSASEDCTPDNGKSKGPWNNKPQTKKSSQQDDTPTVVEEKVPEAPAKPALYKPPSASLHRGSESSRRGGHGKNLPDIHNDDYFPQLGSGGKRGPAWSSAGGAPPAATPTRHALPLNNRFTHLQDDS